MTNQLNDQIGKQLKLARQGNGWSLDATSKMTGVSKAMLGQIERGESSPTIAKLWQIAGGFKLPLSFFLADKGLKENQGPFNHIDDVEDDGIKITTLFPFDEKTQLEVFMLTLAPGHTQLSKPHVSGVIEHLLMISGEIEYLVDDEWRVLTQGNVAKFSADQPHGYRNKSAVPVMFQNLICYTETAKPTF